MTREVRPEDTSRALAYKLWMKAPNPMVTLVKTFDVTRLVKIGKKRNLKFNMLLGYCIGKAARGIPEFYLLPVGDKLVQYDSIAVSMIVKNKNGEIGYCDVPYSEDLGDFGRDYMKNTAEVAENLRDIDLSADCMVIGTSAIVETEIDGAVGMNSGVFNNPFLIWGRYRKRFFRYYLPVSFQFHHTQMDGGHAGKFLAELQRAIDSIE